MRIEPGRDGFPTYNWLDSHGRDGFSPYEIYISQFSRISGQTFIHFTFFAYLCNMCSTFHIPHLGQGLSIRGALDFLFEIGNGGGLAGFGCGQFDFEFFIAGQ